MNPGDGNPADAADPADAVVAALAATPVAPADAVDALPGAPGVVAWWIRPEVLAALPVAAEPDPGRAAGSGADGTRLLDLAPATMLRNRVRRQQLYRTGVSPLRRVLAGWLLAELGLAPLRAAEVILPRADEERLTAWMRANLGLTWWVTPTGEPVPPALLDELTARLGPAVADSAPAAEAAAAFDAAAGEKVTPAPGELFRRP